MGKVIHFEVVECEYTGDIYSVNGVLNDKYSDIINYTKNVCYEINRTYMGKIDKSVFISEIGDNYAVISKNNQISVLVFNLSKQGGVFLAKATIIILENGIGTIWMYLPEILQMVLDGSYKESVSKMLDINYLDSLRKKSTARISKEVEKHIRERLIPDNFVCSRFIPEVWGEGFVCFINDMRQSSMNNSKEYLLNQDNIGITKEDENILIDYEADEPIYFTYQVPSLKNRPKQESYFAEKKIIKSDRKNNNLYWEVKARKGNKEFCNKISFQLHEVDYKLIDEEINKIRSIMRGE